MFSLQHRRVKSKGAPGLAFETWDPSNQFPLETLTLLFVIRSEGICSAPSVCPAPTGPQPPPIITKYTWKHQPPLCLSAFPGKVRGTADLSAARDDKKG